MRFPCSLVAKILTEVLENLLTPISFLRDMSFSCEANMPNSKGSLVFACNHHFAVLLPTKKLCHQKFHTKVPYNSSGSHITWHWCDFHLKSSCICYVVTTDCRILKYKIGNGIMFIPNFVKQVSWFKSWKGGQTQAAWWPHFLSLRKGSIQKIFVSQ
jgi:hypothetical protein